MKYRLHLYNGKITPWFPGEDLTQMVKKHEGRIVTIGKENDEKPEISMNVEKTTEEAI